MTNTYIDTGYHDEGTEETISIWWIILFIAVIIILLTAIVLISTKKKKEKAKFVKLAHDITKKKQIKLAKKDNTKIGIIK